MDDVAWTTSLQRAHDPEGSAIVQPFHHVFGAGGYHIWACSRSWMACGQFLGTMLLSSSMFSTTASTSS
eukprot:scaffold196761_cov47-Attheya_sp.AAC.1